MEISLADLKELMGSNQSLPDKDYGNIVLVLRNGFIFVGATERKGWIGYLRGYQVRFFSKRDGGLPQFASGGPVSEDKLDKIEGVMEFPWSNANVIWSVPCGQNWKTKLSVN